MVQKFTKPSIAFPIAPERGNTCYYDGDVLGFGVRVTAAGAKSFDFNYRNKSGRKRRMTIAPSKAGVILFEQSEIRSDTHRLVLSLRNLFSKGLVPLTIYKGLQRAIPEDWYPKDQDYKISIQVDGIEKKLFVDLSETVGREAFIFGWYDRYVLRFARELIKAIPDHESGFLIDVGAHIGNHTVYLADLFSGVVCFEPNPTVRERLSENCKESGLDSIVQIMSTGLSDKGGDLPFRIRSGGATAKSCVGIRKSNHKAKVVIADEILPRLVDGRIIFIKMDIEGHEGHALRGMTKVIGSHRPVILLEYGRATMNKERKYISSLFLNFDYLSYKINNYSKIKQIITLKDKIIFSLFDYEEPSCNVFAIPKEKSKLFENTITNQRDYVGIN